MESILLVYGLLNLIIAVYLLSHTNMRCDSKSKKVKPLEVNRLRYLITVQRNNHKFYQFK
jgi:hypothetical protein